MSFVEVVIKPIAEEICPKLNNGMTLTQLESVWGGENNRVLTHHKAIQDTFHSASVIRYMLIGIHPKWAGDDAYLSRMLKLSLEISDEAKRGIDAYKDGNEPTRNAIPFIPNPNRGYAEFVPEGPDFSPESPFGQGE